VHVDDRGPVARERSGEHPLEIGCTLDANAEEPCGGRDRRKVGVVEVGTPVHNSGRLHLQLHEGQRPVVGHDDLHRQPLLAKRDEFAQQHREAAIS
jgi:hypothetical protein